MRRNLEKDDNPEVLLMVGKTKPFTGKVCRKRKVKKLMITTGSLWAPDDG